MKVVITSVGEPTTELCERICKKMGFDVQVMNRRILWRDKYKRFIQNTKEDCFRIDADSLPLYGLQKIEEMVANADKDALIFSTKRVDMYSWSIDPGGPIFYRKEAIEMIRERIEELDPFRPESSACRLSGINDRKVQLDIVTSLHGFYQTEIEQQRTKGHRERRKQVYEGEIIESLNDICRMIYQ